MNANAVARNYARLTPEERFRLILAASAGDDAERTRLVNAGERIGLCVRDHAPFGFAFDEVSLLVFVELVELAAHYSECIARAGEVGDILDDDDAEQDEAGEAEEEPAPKADAEPPEDAHARPLSERLWDLALAAGFVLRTKADGWKLFCERLNVAPFLLWEGLPGLDRLRRFLALTEKAAFVDEGFLRWWNRTRPAGVPERVEVPMTAEGMADATEEMFRDRVKWWCG